MEYLTSADCAKKWNVSQRRVAIYCKEGRIEGAVMMGRMWMIPKSAEKPEDPRKTKKEHINSFSALIKKTNDKTQKRPLTIKIESDR